MNEVSEDTENYINKQKICAGGGEIGSCSSDGGGKSKYLCLKKLEIGILQEKS